MVLYCIYFLIELYCFYWVVPKHNSLGRFIKFVWGLEVLSWHFDCSLALLQLRTDENQATKKPRVNVAKAKPGSKAKAKANHRVCSATFSGVWLATSHISVAKLGQSKFCFGHRYQLGRPAVRLEHEQTTIDRGWKQRVISLLLLCFFGLTGSRLLYSIVVQVIQNQLANTYYYIYSFISCIISYHIIYLWTLMDIAWHCRLQRLHAQCTCICARIAYYLNLNINNHLLVLATNPTQLPK